MVALRICVSVISVCINRKSVFMKTVSVTSRDLQSMFFMVLRRVCFSSRYMGQWRTTQHQNRNCKLVLMYPENYARIFVHVNDLGLHAVL